MSEVSIIKELRFYIGNIEVALSAEHENLTKAETRIEMLENERKNLMKLVEKHEKTND